MMLKKLNNNEITDIYNTYLVKDFPTSEVKPLKKILDGVELGKYEVYGYVDGELSGYAYFIKSSVNDTFLLDYFAVLEDKRSKGIGSHFLTAIKDMVAKRGGHLILEVENPEYEPKGVHKDYMIKRIGFYKKNGLRLSNVSCTFCGNEYRIFYGGEELSDDAVFAETNSVYRDFFGDDFIEAHCVFHPY